MSISFTDIESAAPDQASLNAAKKLLSKGKWPLLAHDADSTLLWGQCQGSGASAYSVSVALHDLGAKCSCPSRKFPCKHALALMWWYAEDGERFVAGDVPQWVSDWLSRRRGSAASTSKTQPAAKPSIGLAKAAAPETKEVDAKRSEKQKQRNREQREKAILAGLDELDTWVKDQLDAGLLAFESRIEAQCRTMSKRLVDAKAGGLATRLQSMARAYFGVAQAKRHTFVLEQLGLLQLISASYRQAEHTPEPLLEDVRSAVGWNLQRQELIDDKSAHRVNANWCVLGHIEEQQVDNLLRTETWLFNLDSASTLNSSAYAVLMDFTPVRAGIKPPPAMPAGQTVQAECVFYPSSVPMRAVLNESSVASQSFVLPSVEYSLSEALEQFTQLLVINPILERCILSFSDVHLRTGIDQQSYFVSQSQEAVVPLHPAYVDAVACLSGLSDLQVHGIYNGHDFIPLAVNSPIGPWWLN